VRGLGRGAFGKVYLIKEKVQGAAYDPKMDLMSLDLEEIQNIKEETAFAIDLEKQQRESKILEEHRESRVEARESRVEIRESKIFEDENYLSSDESGKVRAKQQRLLKKESSSL
jgi:hypothetical protein